MCDWRLSVCVFVYVCVVWERLGGPIRPTTLIPLAASSCHVVSALGLLFLPFGLSGNVSAGVPSHPPHPIACSHVPKAPIMAIGPDGRRHYEPAMRTCPTNPPPGARPPGTTWHQMLASVWRWDCRPIRLVDRVPHLFSPGSCGIEAPTTSAVAGRAMANSCTFPVARRLHLFKHTRAVRRAIWEREPGEEAWICSSTQDPVEKGEGVRRAWGGERTVDAVRVSWTGPGRLRGGRGKSSR